MNRAMALLTEVGSKARPAQKKLKDLGAHPKDRKPVTLHEGRFGPYLKHGKQNASLPKGESAEQLTLDRAVQLLAERAAKAKGKAGKAKAAGKSSARAGKGRAKASAGTSIK